MGLNASAMLGAEQVAGVRVNHRGFGKAIMAGGGGKSAGTWGGGAATGLGGAIGSSILARWAAKRGKVEGQEAITSTAPDFGRIAFLVLTAGELALIGLDTKTTSKLTAVLARVPRSEVASVDIVKAAPLMAKPLTVRFTNGEQWLLEVPAPMKRNGKKVVSAFARRS
jgi:hypothetical protein